MTDTASLDTWLPRDEIAEVTGLDASRVSVEALPHNPRNAVTAGVWRIHAGSQRFVVKVLTRNKPPGAPEWATRDDPAYWNHWRREAEVYRGGVRALLTGTGLGMPEQAACFEEPGRVSLWLEDVSGRPGSEWTPADHVAAARALGRFHARGLLDPAVLAESWTSRRFLAEYTASKQVDDGVLEDDRVWREPFVADTLGDPVREAARILWRSQTPMRAILDRLPRTPSHLDFWPMNLIRRPGGEIVAIDWAFFGDGALGEDLGNHVPDSVFDLFVASGELAELDRAAFDAYVDGLGQAGWAGDPRLARLGMCASAVKYAWLLPLLLNRLRAGESFAYGGAEVQDLAHQLRERGRTLIHLAGWVREADAIAVELGLATG